jgi:hypothetical protein
MTTTSVAPETSTSTSTSTTATSVALGHVDLTQSGKGGGTPIGFIVSGLAVLTLGAAAVAFLRMRPR